MVWHIFSVVWAYSVKSAFQTLLNTEIADTADTTEDTFFGGMGVLGKIGVPYPFEHRNCRRR